MSDGPIIDLPPNQYQHAAIIGRYGRKAAFCAPREGSASRCASPPIAHIMLALGLRGLLLPDLGMLGVILYLIVLLLLGWNIVRLIRAIPLRQLW